MKKKNVVDTTQRIEKIVPLKPLFVLSRYFDRLPRYKD